VLMHAEVAAEVYFFPGGVGEINVKCKMKNV
jgi:hypothetical protein